MEEQLVLVNTAKLAKEKGFDESYDNVFDKDEIRRLCYYEGDGTGFVKNSEINNQYETFSFTIPTQSLLQKWLREVHKINVWVECPYDFADESVDLDTYKCIITKGLFLNTTETEFYNSYEEALEDGLLKALNLIK